LKIIMAPRGRGKTTELIKISNKEWKYIVCVNAQRVDNVAKMAQEMGLAIPYPITVRELPMSRGSFIESVLIDDIEDVLFQLIGKPVDCVTALSCEIVSPKGGSK